MPEDKAREIIHGYYASISFVDAQIGRVLDELRRLELDKNTIVPPLVGQRLALSVTMAAGANRTTSNRVTRITLMVSVPGKPGNRQTEALVELIDIYPTLCELCGLIRPPIWRAPVSCRC